MCVKLRHGPKGKLKKATAVQLCMTAGSFDRPKFFQNNFCSRSTTQELLAFAPDTWSSPSRDLMTSSPFYATLSPKKCKSTG